MEDAQLTDLLQELSSLLSSPSWSARHGSVLTIKSMLRHNPTAICMSPFFQSIVDDLKETLKDEKVYIPMLLHLMILLFPNVNTFCQTVPSSWNINEGFGKACTPSNSTRTIEQHCTSGYSFIRGICFAWWLQWSEKKGIICSKSSCKSMWLRFCNPALKLCTVSCGFHWNIYTLYVANCIAGKSINHFGPYFCYRPLPCWVFEGWKYSSETCCRKMCSACLPIDKGYFLLFFIFLSPISAAHFFLGWPINNKLSEFFTVVLIIQKGKCY